MSVDAPQPPGPEVWNAQFLRLIAFPMEPAFEHSAQWWRDLTETEPQSNTERLGRQEREVSGPFDGVDLSLTVDLLRAQWTATPVIDAAIPPDGSPHIGQFIQRREWFRNLMLRWLNSVNRPIKRLAFGCVLMQSAADHRAAYERLNQYLRWVDIDPDSYDFLYRINRRCVSQSGIDNLTINRLASWAALVFQLQQRMFLPGTATIQQHALRVSYSTIVDLDINTAAEWQTPFPPAQLGPVFTELTDFALDIARDGDPRP